MSLHLILTEFLLGWRLPQMHQVLDKNNLAGLATIAVSLGFYCPAFIVLIRINRIADPELLFTYPNYILVHFLHHGIVFIWNFYLLFNYFSNSKQLRSAILREIKDLISRILGCVKENIEHLKENYGFYWSEKAEL